MTRGICDVEVDQVNSWANKQSGPSDLKIRSTVRTASGVIDSRPGGAFSLR